MRLQILSRLPMAVLRFAASLAGAAPEDEGLWQASSSTARSITGDISFAPTSLVIRLASFPLAEIRALRAEEVSSLFDADAASGVSGRLYRTRIPGTRRFEHKNTLCGNDDTQWVATFVEGHDLHMALFSGEKMPVFTREAIANSTSLCGTFLYSR
jgi:hypothetical protein